MARRTTSPFAVFLCAIFLFSAHVLAVSAVLGVDLGTGFIKAALVKPGIPLEIVLTKDARRKETSAIAFKPSTNGPNSGSYPERFYGSDAVALAPRFPGDVYPNLKALLGLPADHAAVKEYAARHPALKVVTHDTKGTAAFKSAGAFPAEEEAWLVEELLAMELQSIRANAEALAGPDSTVRSVVITVPPFYTTEEKRAVELAADLAGLRVLSLISDSLAVGLHYATSRQFPNINEGGKPEYHMIFDMGTGSTKASVLRFQSRTVKDVGKFNKTVQEVQVLGSGWDRSLGGDALNSLIVDDMVSQFVESPKAQKASVALESVKTHGRAIAKITKEAERLRHILSANTDSQTNFEGLYDDIDFKYKISRADFEAFAESQARKVAVVIQDALDAAGLQVGDLESVILHGGASRTPFIQKELETVLGGPEKVRSNVNADEAAVFGAGFRAADISPSFRVKEIRVSDSAAYPAGMKWTDDKQKPRHQRLWTATSSLGAAPKEVTLPVLEDFSTSFYQLVPVPGAEGSSDSVEAETKVFATKNLTATVEHLVEKYACEKSEIYFKVGVRLASENGEVEVTKATLECEVDEPEKEGFVDGVKNLFGFGKKDQQPLTGDEDSAEDPEVSSSTSTTSESETSTTSSTTTSGSSSSTTTSTDAASASADSEPEEKKKQLITIPVDYTLEKAGMPTLSKTEVVTVKDRLKAFESSDRSRRLREEALNQLEGLTYKVRDLLDSEDFITASSAQERQDLEKKSSEASDWLYGDGADASREELKSRVKGLQEIISPIEKRIEEGPKRPELIKDLKEALEKTSSFVASVKENIAEYEAFESARVASSASSTTTSTDTSTVTEAPTADDFDGLEDDDATTSTTTAPEMEDRGPVPPIYTLEDLKETEEAYASVSTWLEGKLAEQEKLGPADDPVLLAKDLSDKRAKLDKVGLDLAMKGVRNFEKKKKSSSSSSKSKTKTKTKGSKTAKSKKPTSTLDAKPEAETKFLSDEELAELLKEYDDSKVAGEEPQAQQSKEAQENTERKHEEL